MSILKPDVDELKAALLAAEAMRAEGADPHHVALTLRYLYQRCKALESLLLATDRYLRFGMPEHELSEMRLLVGRLREDALSAEDSDEVDSTLPI
jgi:hypothetical protein